MLGEKLEHAGRIAEDHSSGTGIDAYDNVVSMWGIP